MSKLDLTTLAATILVIVAWLTMPALSQANIVVEPSEYNFEDVKLGEPEFTTIEIFNQGERLAVINACWQGDNEDFAFIPPFPFLLPGATVDVEVMCDPSALGRVWATLLITSKAGDQVLVQLSGNGIEANGEINSPPVAIADTGPNQDEVKANAGPNHDRIEANTTGGANVVLDGSASYDPDGDDLTYQWMWDDGSAEGATPTVFLPLGTTTVTLIVNDGKVDSEPDEVIVEVVDTTPPEIFLDTPDPSILWPPNHKLVDVYIAGSALDICDIDPDIDVSVEVTDSGGGNSGPKHEPDYEIVSATADGGNIAIVVLLRAERSGKGTGRSYSITAEVTDDSGNSNSDTVEVFAPHSKGKGKKK